MKFLVIIIALIAPLIALGQSPTPEYERAYYEVNVNGESAFYTDIHCSSALFDRDQFFSLKDAIMQKEGVFQISHRDDGKTIRIAHLSFVEAETLKEFGNMICDGITVDDRQPFTF